MTHFNTTSPVNMYTKIIISTFIAVYRLLVSFNFLQIFLALEIAPFNYLIEKNICVVIFIYKICLRF